MKNVNPLGDLMNVLSLGLVVLIGYILYLLYDKGLFGGIWSLLGGGSKGTDYKNPTVTPSASLSGGISVADAQRLANMAHNAMAIIGTNHVLLNSVYDNLVGRPLATVQVNNQFGSRPYAFTGSPSLGFDGTNMSLWEWLVEELSEKDLVKWKNLFNVAGIV